MSFEAKEFRPSKSGNPLISVILPIYNGASFLEDAIDSILNQTIVDFELIAINDGSTDRSLDILRAYEKIDERVKVFSHTNKGLTRTLNDALDLANGQWIARMDQDDIALPHRFEKQLEHLRISKADIVGSWVKRFGATDNRTVKLSESDNAIKMEMLFTSPFAHPTVMMRASLIKQLRYDHSRDKAEDYDLWVRAAIAGYKMANVPEVLLHYRVHASQISTAMSSRQLELSQGIRYAYWDYLLNLWNKDKSCIEPIIKVRSTNCDSNADLIDQALNEVMLHCNAEAKSVVLGHAYRIYLRMAAYCPDIVERWSKLSNTFTGKTSFKSKLVLKILRTFRISPESKLFIGMRATVIYLQAR
ncbi:glycosyl transferase family 2 [Pseudomonas protegens]|uniref:glycosyltransferase family 2 protein n=1 Tax=Pseudomonas TaxID=286 RepID=UPI000D91383E|nr:MULTISPECIES: glycosyltransferase [Pseudomonas]MDD1019191.1 glycosyltransferase [Pseudomonas idahonensis]MDP9535366.1 glycosyltransferase [Pseudomonas protegens]PYC00633.1 glycosyl transferase family 2 [Pseudomonas protegens]